MPQYYRILVTRARQYHGVLQLAPKPLREDGLGWQELPVAQLAVSVMENEELTAVDTELAEE